ncbi:MAG: peptidoglycan DD-metalloendopeptidase family protein [Fibromonadaceae bacterium]|nr:peptidoglycan DD-metalloendopeptidase family protein [Fibromonadaceae bacterium]
MASAKWLVASGLVLLTLQAFAAPASSVDKQLKSNAAALKKNQEDIQKAETKVKELENKEFGVLKTIAEIDHGLTQTREQLYVLQKKENSLKTAIKSIEEEIAHLQENIDTQKKAIAARIRDLYIHGKREEWELLFNLLKENENPKRKLYWVQRLLESDRVTIETYLASLEKQQEKREQLETKQKEMEELHESKSKEESKYQNQLLFQTEVLTKVKKDKTTQQRVIEEYKQNQQTLTALIATLEKKRQAELLKRQAEQSATTKKKIENEVPVAVGPKCTPLSGEIISRYGYHENKDLGIRLEHKGTEIRGQKGDVIKAAAAGTVVMTGNIPGHGPSVILDHRGSYYSVYGHLGSIKVKEGENVKNCQEIGSVGNAESTNGYKLYFQVYKISSKSAKGQTQDPILWLKN